MPKESPRSPNIADLVGAMAAAVKHWALVIAELRRCPQMSYKTDIVAISGLDDGDIKAFETKFGGSKGAASPTSANFEVDKEDGRLLLRGPTFTALEVMNLMTEQRGYVVEFNPQQRAIPLKQGNTEDRFSMIYHLWKPRLEPKAEPVPPPRSDSLHNG